MFSAPLLILSANSSRASGDGGFAFPARLISPNFSPNAQRRDFASSIRCYSPPRLVLRPVGPDKWGRRAVLKQSKLLR
jgi:hypothetical protein